MVGARERTAPKYPRNTAASTTHIQGSRLNPGPAHSVADLQESRIWIFLASGRDDSISEPTFKPRKKSDLRGRHKKTVELGNIINVSFCS